MEEEQKKNLDLVEVKNNSLKEISKRVFPKVADGMKRIGKVVGYGSIALLGLGTFFLGSGPIAVCGLAASLLPATRTIKNALYKTEPSLMFISKVENGESEIFQDLSLSHIKKMNGYTNIEKGGMMALQALVGFSRYKENLKESPYEIGENGEKIYCQKISTVSHGINLKTFQILENLGYIKIDSMDDKFKRNIAEKVSGREPRGEKSLLILEKLFFKNYEDLKKITKAGLTRDKDTLESMKKPLTKINFRLTDKPIDFEELYKKSLDLNQIQDKKQKTALRRLAVIFDKDQGILATKNVDIGKDRFGRDIIKYNVGEPFAKRIDRSIRREKLENQPNIRDRIRQEVDVEKVIQKHNEKMQRNTIDKDRDGIREENL